MQLVLSARSASYASFLSCALVATSSAQIAFTPAPEVPTGPATRGAALADVDLDGILDLAVLTDAGASDAAFRLFRGDGQGGFAPSATVPFLANESPTDLVARDFAGDTRIEVAVLIQSPDAVVLLQDQGAAGYSASAPVATGGLGSSQIEAGDLNGDGAIDLVISSRDSNSLSILLNDQGAIGPAATLPVGGAPEHVAIGDFDGDGDQDLALARRAPRGFVFLSNDGTGSFTQTQVFVPGQNTLPFGATFADLDDDGDLDFIGSVQNPSGGFLNASLIYRNDGAGGFTGPSASSGSGVLAGRTVVADFDVDGQLDLALGGTDVDFIGVSKNRGGGTFLTVSGFLVPSPRSSELLAGDVDRNGSPDFVSVRTDGSAVTILLNGNSIQSPIGVNYCPTNANSTGAAAIMSALGSDAVADNDLSLRCRQLPANTVGYFLVAPLNGFTEQPAGSQGNLCLGNLIGRFSNSVLSSGASGLMVLPIDLTALPSPSGPFAVMPGEDFFFQLWFRDASGGGATSNFSDGLRIDFR